MMKVYGIFMGYILVPINIVEYIRESPNDILDVKISDIYQTVTKKWHPLIY